MSKRKPFFVESPLAPFDGKQCDKCKSIIADVEDGKMFWNRNSNHNTHHKNYCRKCYAEWGIKRVARFQKWQDAQSFEELTEHMEADAYQVFKAVELLLELKEARDSGVYPADTRATWKKIEAFLEDHAMEVGDINELRKST